MLALTLVDIQLDAQNSYLFTYNTFIKILYMFRALPCTSSRGLRGNYIYAASGNVTSFLTGSQDSHLQRVTIPEATYIQLRRRPPEDEQGNARNIQRILINVLYVNKYEFCASNWISTKVIYTTMHAQPVINSWC